MQSAHPASTSRVRLIHWNAAEAAERAARLRAAGYRVEFEMLTPEGLRELRANPPHAVVIDLSRTPSHGRDVGLGLRSYKATRHVPLVFVEGDREKVARLKELLPDAVYTTWSRIRGSLKRAIAEPPRDPAVPGSVLAGYSGTPLTKKLGIKVNSLVALIGAPPGFEKTLGKLPDGVTLRRRAGGRADLIIWFSKSCKDLESRIGRVAERVGRDGLWIAWPKKSSRKAADLSQAEVRRIGLAAGLVDYKVCAIDATWSGLKFTRKKGK
jgi:CheY-like chemotaxis protein